MMVNFKISTTKNNFRTDIPVIPLVGEKITIHGANSGAYKVKSIEHEIKGGFYNTCVVLSAVKKTIRKTKTVSKK